MSESRHDDKDNIHIPCEMTFHEFTLHKNIDRSFIEDITKSTTEVEMHAKINGKVFAEPRIVPRATVAGLKPDECIVGFDGTYERSMSPETKTANYRASNSAIAVCEAVGCRATPEDRAVVGRLDGRELSGLTPEDWDIAYKAATAEIHAQVEAGKLRGGTCMGAVAVVGGRLQYANLGDSTSWVVIVKDDGTVSVKRLNDLQKGPVKDEKGNVLAVGASIGDVDFPITRIPECGSYQPEIPLGAKAYVVIACDGITEMCGELSADKNQSTKADKEAETMMRDAVIRSRNHEEIASALVLKALQGSKDNVTAIVIPIDPKAIHPVYGVVFDGHGPTIAKKAGDQLIVQSTGDSVAEYAYQHFAKEFAKQLALRAELRATQAPESVKKSEEQPIAKCLMIFCDQFPKKRFVNDEYLKLAATNSEHAKGFVDMVEKLSALSEEMVTEETTRLLSSHAENIADKKIAYWVYEVLNTLGEKDFYSDVYVKLLIEQAQHAEQIQEAIVKIKSRAGELCTPKNIELLTQHGDQVGKVVAGVRALTMADPDLANDVNFRRLIEHAAKADDVASDIVQLFEQLSEIKSAASQAASEPGLFHSHSELPMPTIEKMLEFLCGKEVTFGQEDRDALAKWKFESKYVELIKLTSLPQAKQGLKD